MFLDGKALDVMSLDKIPGCVFEMEVRQGLHNISGR